MKITICRAEYQAAMVKAYNGALVLADILLLILKILYYICESVYRFFIPSEEKSVAGEIVLVCNIFRDNTINKLPGSRNLNGFA